MCFIFSLIPATAWLVIGYFVLFASGKANGKLRKFGQILAIWIFVIAAIFPLGGLYVTLAGICPMETIMQQMHELSGP